MGNLHAPGELANNDYAKFLGGKEVYYGIVQVVNTLKNQMCFRSYVEIVLRTISMIMKIEFETIVFTNIS